MSKNDCCTFEAEFEELNSLSAEFDEEELLTSEFGETQVLHTDNYYDLYNKPTINNITVEGNKTGLDYRLQDKMEEATVAEIERILYLDL